MISWLLALLASQQHLVKPHTVYLLGLETGPLTHDPPVSARIMTLSKLVVRSLLTFGAAYVVPSVGRWELHVPRSTFLYLLCHHPLEPDRIHL